MIDKLVCQGYHKNKLAEKFIHFTRMYTHLWIKFGVDLNLDIINRILF